MPTNLTSTQSFWIQSAALGLSKKLDQNRTADVVVVGAGIAGMTTAYLLLKAGKKVVLVERGSLAEGDTGYTTAHLTVMADPGYAGIQKMHGKHAARIVFETHRAAIDLIEETASRGKIQCDFNRVAGYLFLDEHQAPAGLREELEALKEAGFGDARWEEEVPLAAKPGRAAICLPRQARFHPLKYLRGLREAILAAGGEIYTETLVTQIEDKGILTDAGMRVEAPHIVLATHSPFAGSTVFLKQSSYRTYVVGARIAKGSVKDALYWDTADPYHYVRLEPLNEHEDLLIAGGEDHKTGQAAPEEYAHVFEELENWTRRSFSGIRHFEYRWSGQVLEPIDGLPYIGKISHRHSGVHIATGFSGNGMTYGTAAAVLLTDLILGHKNPQMELYDPARKKVSSAGEFFKENLNNAKEMFEKRMGKGCISSLTELAAGEGAILAKGMKRIAVYREDAKTVHQVSAVCPHLGCIVQWNSVEKTFDCPCHGSRFTAKGGVIHGPANKNLEPWPKSEGS